MTRTEWDALLDQGADTWWAPLVGGLIAELADVARPGHTPTQMCHLDVCPENVFLCDGRLTVIDWENAGPAATIQDLGSTLWDFCRDDIERITAFVDHYRRHGGPIERLEVSVYDTARVVAGPPHRLPLSTGSRPGAHARDTSSGPNGDCAPASLDHSPDN